jgi:carboxyl-terminal processing protease
MVKSKLILFLLLIVPTLTRGQTNYQKDFEEFWTNIHDNYAYLKQQDINWERVKEIYQPQAASIANKDEFIKLLENVLHEVYNGHSSLNINLESSNRLVPSGQDLYVEKIGRRFMVTDLRKGYGAQQCGLKVGMEVQAFNGMPVEGQLQNFLPKYTAHYNAEMIQFALDMLFAGTHDKPRSITALENGHKRVYHPDSVKIESPKNLIEFRKIYENTGYIRINNSLGNNDLIAAFDQALDSLFNTRNLVLDLTETPGGGNSTVARAMMGRFISQKLPYQQHEVDETAYDTKRYWVEYVLPRKKTYNGTLYVLVGHWTGSMGEGIAIGFDGMKRATVIGTRMAGLLGSIEGFELTETKIRYQFPTERLYHINGTPREKYLPKVLTKNTEETYRELDKIK